MLKLFSQHQNTLRNILILFLVVSCKNEPKNPDTSKPEEKNTVIENTNSDIIYSIKGDCDSFIQGIDFSSLCVTEQK